MKTPSSKHRLLRWGLVACLLFLTLVLTVMGAPYHLYSLGHPDDSLLETLGVWWLDVGVALGVLLVINPDAHSTGGLSNYRYGVDVARRGWLEKQHVFNTRPLAEITRMLSERKKR